MVVGIALGLYGVTYLALSTQGKYEPAIWGLGGVKSYGWAPRGFMADLRWRRSMLWIFAPLYFSDIRVWHTSALADSGRYPVHEISSPEPNQ